jgi:hypothetical protein
VATAEQPEEPLLKVIRSLEFCDQSLGVIGRGKKIASGGTKSRMSTS